MITDVAGHVAYVLILAGLWRLGREEPRGFILQMIGSCIWCGIGLNLGLSSIVVWNTVFALISILGYFRLRNKRKNDHEVQNITASANR